MLSQNELSLREFIIKRLQKQYPNINEEDNNLNNENDESVKQNFNLFRYGTFSPDLEEYLYSHRQDQILVTAKVWQVIFIYI